MDVKAFEALISVKFFTRNDKIFQHFLFKKKKDKKYLTDKRYIVYNKFEEKLQELSLSNSDNYEFIERRDEEDRIVLVFFILDDNIEKPLDNFFFVIPGFIPPNPGCLFCVYKTNIKETNFYCDFKQEFLAHNLKTCKFFKQKHDLFKT